MLHAKVVKDVPVGFSGVQRQICLRTAETAVGDLLNASPGERPQKAFQWDKCVNISTEGWICGLGWGAGQRSGEWRAKLVSIVMVWRQ